MSAIREIQQAAAALYERSEISASKTAARFKVQREIEDAIMSFRPDFYEAEEILAALMGALSRRYDPEDFTGKDRELVQAVHDAGDAFGKAIDAAYGVPQ